MRSSTLRPWRSLGKTVSTETILTWVQLSSSSLYSPKSSQHSSKTWWAHVCSLWAGWSEEGGSSSLMGHRTVLNWSLHCFYLFWASVLSARIHSSNVVHLDPKALRIQGVALIFHWHGQTTSATPNICWIRFNTILSWDFYGSRGYSGKIWHHLVRSLAAPRQCISAHPAGAGESVLALSQHQILKTHEPLPCSDVKM